MKILIVEDEKKTATYLRKGLQENGFVADVALEGEEGLFLALSRDYDLIILDIMLPGKDGWAVVSDLRKNHKQTPVLLLTARDSVEDRVKGLELGADDYLIKPFAFSELLARVRSLLRRLPTKQEDVIRVADLEIDLSRHRAVRNGRMIDLTPKEFLLLSLLARRKGEVLSRTVIAEQVWDMNFEVESNVVDVHIRRLRSKVDESYTPRLVHTIRGIGYMLEDRG